MNHNLHWHVYYTSRDVATMTWHCLDIERLNLTNPYLLNSRFLYLNSSYVIEAIIKTKDRELFIY